MHPKTRNANRKMRHAFKYLNGSYTGYPKHAPQNRYEWKQRETWANQKARSLKKHGYTWQATRIHNYNHRLRQEWSGNPYMPK